MTPSPGAVEAALRSMFPTGVAVAVERIVPASPDLLWPEERPAVAGAVPSRLAEFTAGRTAARRVLQALGYPPSALPMAPDRAALWPEGVVGSIAHAAGLAVAVARRGAPLGVDIEDATSLAPDLWTIICRPDELQRLDKEARGEAVKQIFCAKEAVFKAQDSSTRVLFGHETLDVTLAETGFEAQFLTDAGAFRAGQIVRGRIALVEGVVLAGVAV
jgi:4'-phosphopantetheinyl transferase EntD